MTTPDQHYATPEDIPAAIPVFPLANALLLPRGQLPLNIFEPRYVEMITAAWESDRLIGMIQPATQKDIEMQNNAKLMPDLASVGCVGRITSFDKTDNGHIMITLTGLIRFNIVKELKSSHPYRMCQVDCAAFSSDFTPGAGEEDVDRKTLLAGFRNFLDANHLDADWEIVKETGTEALVNSLCIMSPYGHLEKQALLEAKTLKARSELLMALNEMALVPHGDTSKHTLQ